MNPDQIILIDKPAGMTSFGVVARIRRYLSEQLEKEGEQTDKTALPAARSLRGNMVAPQKRQCIKVGHTGTLDPFATGLMIILTGKMTKKSNEFLKLDKIYEATIYLGATSTTGDPEGEITSWEQPDCPSVSSAPPKRSTPSDIPILRGGLVARVAPLVVRARSNEPEENRATPNPDNVNEVLKSFVGEITQTPPIYSAIKVNGQRAYKLARQGKKVEIPKRKVRIYSVELLNYDYPELKIRAHVSSGTYIRTLAEDIGKKLGVGAYLTALRRTKIADYDLKDAKALADFGISS